ncbi:MAG: alpha/beta hydrolase [Bacteroidota bacterium]
MKTDALILPAVRRALNGLSKVSPERAGKIAYGLLAKPRRPSFGKEAEDFLAKANSRSIVSEGKRIAVYNWPGQGPSILMLHGWESSTGRWWPYYETFKDRGFDIHAIDAPAQGASEGTVFSAMAYAAAIGVYVESLEKPPQFWLGHSAGGMASIYYLCRLKGQIRPEKLLIMGVPSEMQNFVDKFCEIVGLNRIVHAGIEREFKQAFGFPFSHLSFSQMAEELEMPGLIIHDEGDDLAPVEGAKLIHQAWENSELMITQGRTHSVLGEDMPGIVADYFV